MCAGRGDAHELAAEASELRGKLEKLRFPDWVWASARSMINENTTRTWLSPHRAYELAQMGLSKIPSQVLVCLTLGHNDEPDRVGELIRRDAFQRACVDLAMAEGETVVGRVADQGVAFLVGAQASRARSALAQLSAKATKLARRHGFSLRSGASSAQGNVPLSSRYEQALGAAEGALLRGESLVMAEPGEERGAWRIPRLRRMLSEGGSEQPQALATRFERYAQAVVLHSGYKLDLARAHLEAGFDQVARSLLPSDALEQKSFLDLSERLDREARDAANVSDLFSIYRRGIADLIAAVENPVEASRDRGLRRALSFAERHLAEPITLTQIARVAGFAPTYFCKLFKQREHVTFEQYLRTLRIERAKQLLVGTDLPIERVAQITGFPLRHYFHRVFKREVGTTPLVYRNSMT
jgi:AraC-like DNA-binding protein